jgi:glucan 1,3-beta-glucosidase
MMVQQTQSSRSRTSCKIIKSDVLLLTKSLSNAFAYWQGITINAAPTTFFDDTFQSLQHIQNIKGGPIEFWVGETGWPTVGNNYEAAVPGTSQAAQYYQKGICAMKKWGFNVFVFEAFDEPWKPDSIGQNGQAADEKHWGVWDQNRTPKYQFTCS